MTRSESLSKVTKDLMLEEPFYGLFLIGLNKQWTTEIKTARVGLKGIDFYLKINPDFWDSLTHIERKGLVKHELLHIGFFHLTDYSQLTNHKVANIAMDIEINQYIDRDWLPEGGQLPETYPELNLEPKKGTFYYYDKLLEAEQDNNQALQTVLDALENGEDGCELPDGTQVTFTDHDWEAEVGEMDEATTKLIKAQTGHILESLAEQVEKSRGTVPGEFEEILKRLKHLDPPKFDWKGYLRRFIGKSTTTYTKKSRRKPNKRMPEFPGLRLKKRKHVLVAIDTSASVSKPELKEFLNEINHIAKNGTDVTIIECDTAISYIGKFDARKDLEIHGRGGTEFQPVIDYYNENPGTYSCLFYFTDGEAPAPDNCTGNILWVLSECSSMNEDLPGPVIKLEI
jgi:predicted metal-dependent peptidase